MRIETPRNSVAAGEALPSDPPAGSRISRKRALIIFNPTAGFWPTRKLARVCRYMERLGCRPTVVRTTAPGEAVRLAAEVSPGDYDIVVAAGGDGTVNEVVNGLAGKDIPLAILPCGTANVLAAETMLPRSSRKLASLIVNGSVCHLNLGLANGRRFVMMAGVGFDAHLIRGVHPSVKRVLGKGAYFLQFLYCLFRFPRRRYDVTIDGTTYGAASVVIANGHYYGGRFTCAHQARLADCSLDVCLFQSSGPLNLLRYAFALVRGRLHTLPDFLIVRGLEVVIHGSNGDPVQCDGDLAGALPLVARAEGPRLPLIVVPDPLEHALPSDRSELRPCSPGTIGAVAR